MKRLVIAAGLCAAFCVGAMPTKEALDAARPKVMLKTADIVKKLNSGALKPGEAADAFAALTVRPTGEAEKFLLLNAALRLRMRSGDIAGAKAAVDRLKAEIPGITAEQLNALMLEETPNCYAAWFSDDKSAPSARNGKEWHVKKARLERIGLTVTSLDELRKCDRSKVVRLYLRKAKGITDEDLAGLTGIESLDLSETGIGEIPAPVFKMKKLQNLWLARNPIKTVPDDIRELNRLRYLNLDGTHVDRIPDGLAHLPSLYYLRMNDTPLDDGMYTDSKGCRLSHFTETLGKLRLRRLYARNTKITMLPQAYRVGQMTDLDVGGTMISEISSEWGAWSNFRTVSFAGCTKLRRLPENLDSRSKIRFIDLSDTPIAKDKDEIARIRRAIGDKATIIY